MIDLDMFERNQIDELRVSFNYYYYYYYYYYINELLSFVEYRIFIYYLS